ncbi:hypothetical protein [Methylobacterium durans]|uniref:Uncharacterized protein n=1 Tax=Methylobacterium durans TaxID=2202825 RepID=A0A2U8W9M2_9HYPH|nr:hypothetical protein [Methylobacterium durans]AWN42689.1 hypothetical protein DK389_22020 [Methylobacterium durans]
MTLHRPLLALGLAVPLALTVVAPASAFGFSDLNPVKIAKGAVKVAKKATKTVSRTVEKSAKAVGKTVEKGAKSVGHAAESVGQDAVKTVKAAPKAYMKVAKPVGGAISTYYHHAGKAIENTPLKVFKPLADDVAKAARTKEAKIGAAVGVGLLTGGGGTAALLRSGGTAAGAGAMTAYYGKQVYLKGREAAKDYRQHGMKKASGTIMSSYEERRKEIRGMQDYSRR